MNYLDAIDYTVDGFSEFFDELPLWSAPFGLLLLEHVPLRIGATYLDVGAGTGFLTLELAERAGPTSRVIAVDPWSDAMARLRRKVAQRGLTNVSLRVQDAAAIDLPEASVDVIVSNLGINNFENPPAVLGHCHRLAKPGASLLLSTNLVGHMEEFYQLFREVLIELDQTNRLTALEGHIAHRGTVESTERLLRDAGFTVDDTLTRSFRLRFADGTALLHHYFIRLGFVQGWKAVVDPAALERTFAQLERRLNELARERGELSLTIPLACVLARKPR